MIKYGKDDFWKFNFKQYEKEHMNIPDNVNMQALLADLNYSIKKLELIVENLNEKVSKITNKEKISKESILQ